jgi:hypothetical protein
VALQAFFITLPLETVNGAKTLAVDFAENLGGEFAECATCRNACCRCNVTMLAAAAT